MYSTIITLDYLQSIYMGYFFLDLLIYFMNEVVYHSISQRRVICIPQRTSPI